MGFEINKKIKKMFNIRFTYAIIIMKCKDYLAKVRCQFRLEAFTVMCVRLFYKINHQGLLD